VRRRVEPIVVRNKGFALVFKGERGGDMNGIQCPQRGWLKQAGIACELVVQLDQPQRCKNQLGLIVGRPFVVTPDRPPQFDGGDSA